MHLCMKERKERDRDRREMDKYREIDRERAREIFILEILSNFFFRTHDQINKLVCYIIKPMHIYSF